MNQPLEQKWSPARIFMLASALYHLPLGIAGLLYNQAFPIGSAEAEIADADHIFGLFKTNGWHSLAALLLGLLTLYFAFRPRGARTVALVIGVQHVILVAAFIIWPPETFWFASNIADQVIHTITAVGGIGSALLTPKDSADTSPLSQT